LIPLGPLVVDDDDDGAAATDVKAALFCGLETPTADTTYRPMVDSWYSTIFFQNSYKPKPYQRIGKS
jgi:hypothetical protein